MIEKIDNRVIIVKRNTRLDDLIARFNTVSQAKFYVEHLGSSFEDYEYEHNNYYKSLQQVKTSVSLFARFQIIDRVYLPNFIFAQSDIVIIVGQDGLVANTLKYLHGQPAIGVNPDSERWDGVLLPFNPSDVLEVLEAVANKRFTYKNVTLGKASMQNGQELLAVNDFFIGQKTHRSARYMLNYNGQTEQQSSSGIIVSTGLGSSGWLKSVLAGAGGIVSTITSKSTAIKEKRVLSWDADQLIFSVREPFPSKTTGASIVFGKIHTSSPFSVVSQMGENGVIFSDGIENDYIEFNSGMEAMITVSSIKGKLVI
jgi:NAD kinase